MTAIILFKTDFHHSYISRETIGVFTNKQKYRSAVKKIIKNDLQENTEGRDKEETKEYINWNLSFLFEKGQTQGLASFELDTTEVELNKIF